MADGITDVPQVDSAKFKNLDDLIFNILDEGMNRISGLAKAIGAQSVNVVAAGSQALSGASVNPMRGDYISPSSSPETPKGSEVEAPSKARDITKDANPGKDSSQLASGKSLQTAQSNSLVANVDMRDYGTFTPTAVGGKQREESQGISFS